MRSRAAKVAAETDAALDRVCAMLEHYRDRNALRVYAHPYALRAHLVEAREAIARRRDRPQGAVADGRRLQPRISLMNQIPVQVSPGRVGL
jgi:hypothetical protein